MALHVFGPLLIGGLTFAVGCIVRSQEPPGSWLRSHGMLKILAFSLIAAFLALLFFFPAVTMSEST